MSGTDVAASPSVLLLQGRLVASLRSCWLLSSALASECPALTWALRLPGPDTASTETQILAEALQIMSPKLNFGAPKGAGSTALRVATA
eukprot:1549486-Rhodomonas_salina.4